MKKKKYSKTLIDKAKNNEPIRVLYKKTGHGSKVSQYPKNCKLEFYIKRQDNPPKQKLLIMYSNLKKLSLRKILLLFLMKIFISFAITSNLYKMKKQILF